MAVSLVYAIALFLGFVQLSFAQFPLVGKCPDVKVQEDFDLSRFSGQWYEIERTMSFLETLSQCTAVNYTDSGYGDGSVEVVSEGRGPVLKIKRHVRLIAKVPSKDEPAKWRLRLSDLQLKAHYWILNTDYDNYAIIWACNQVGVGILYARAENMWIIARERTLPEETLEKIHARIDTLYKDIKAKSLLKKVNQNNCDD
ncbi:hypothetical protein JTE90_005028 [Oedothorax gibbosus]|uniref:Lipocalin/cytosolic fatty-acid binding domain-containing protein n=1 Tax=Oedothorax gibbosus TaxID=931172 RepID=A0AAV6VCM8_9ARAC|nr:hypothetical protein JTE90_005028 [Oedothorax gibbosus]